MAGTPTDPADVPNQPTGPERAASERAASLRAVFASSPRPGRQAEGGRRRPGEWTGGIPLPGSATPAPGATHPARPAADPASQAGRPGATKPRRKLWLIPASVVVVALAAGAAAVVVDREPRKNHTATFTQDPAPTPSAAATRLAGTPIASGPAPSATPTTTSRSPSASATTNPGKPNKTGANLALRARAVASSEESSAWPAADAVDGNPESRWSSAFADPQWIRIDLGSLWSVTDVRLKWEHAHAVKYRVDISVDGRHWRTVYRTSSGTDGTRDIRLDPTPARYLRMYGTKRSGIYGYSLLEFEVR